MLCYENQLKTGLQDSCREAAKAVLRAHNEGLPWPCQSSRAGLCVPAMTWVSGPKEGKGDKVSFPSLIFNSTVPLASGRQLQALALALMTDLEDAFSANNINSSSGFELYLY